MNLEPGLVDPRLLGLFERGHKGNQTLRKYEAQPIRFAERPPMSLAYANRHPKRLPILHSRRTPHSGPSGGHTPAQADLALQREHGQAEIRLSKRSNRKGRGTCPVAVGEQAVIME